MMIYILLLLLIHVLKGHATLFHCDFETSCVDFEIDDNWNVTTGYDSQLIDHDHTLYNQSGTYLFSKPENTLSEMKTSDWIEPLYNQVICFQLWYYTPQPQFSFDIQLLQGDDESLIRTIRSVSGKDPPINNWTLIYIRLPPEKVKILIRLNMTSDSLAFDDLSVDICDESPPSPPKVLFSCDGESSCVENFMSLSDHPYQWSIIQANDAIKQENQAPTIDYTFNNGSGHYFWLKNSDLIQKGNVGYLAINKSFQITDETSYCLNFYYYGYGEPQMSNLKIYARMLEQPDTVQKLWPKQSSKRYEYTYNNWTWGIINLPAGNYSLLFRMDSQNMNISSFALDNINITSCDYLPSEFSSPPSLLSFSCNFDGSSICDIENQVLMGVPTFNFTIFTGNTIPNRDLGPTQDYTTNSSSGGFFYWNRQSNFSNENLGTFGPSKTIEENTGMCIKFAYYVKSSKDDKYQATLLLIASQCAFRDLWTQMVNDSEGWQLVIIPLQGYACAETFYFTASKQGQTEVSIAFDDIHFEQCSLINKTNIVSSTTAAASTSTSTTTTTAARTTTTTFSSSTTLQNSSQKTFSFNGFKLTIFYFLFIIIEEFIRK